MKDKKNLITVPRLNLILVTILIVVLAYAFYALMAQPRQEKPKAVNTGDSSVVKDGKPAQETTPKTQTSNSTTVTNPKKPEPIKGLINALGGGSLKLNF